VFSEIPIQVTPPLLSGNTLSAEGFDVVTDVWEEYVQTSNGSF